MDELKEKYELNIYYKVNVNKLMVYSIIKVDMRIFYISTWFK